MIYRPPKPAAPINVALIALWLAHTNKKVLR